MISENWICIKYTIITVRVFCPRAGPSLKIKAPKPQFYSKAGLPPPNSGTNGAVLLGTNRCGSFRLLSAPHSLFSIWTDLKRSEKLPVPPAWRWGEWIWLTGPSGLHRNSPQGLNISSIKVFDQIRNPEIPITLSPQFLYNFIKWQDNMNILYI